jgi:hypothetical protein
MKTVRRYAFRNSTTTTHWEAGIALLEQSLILPFKSQKRSGGMSTVMNHTRSKELCTVESRPGSITTLQHGAHRPRQQDRRKDWGTQIKQAQKFYSSELRQRDGVINYCNGEVLTGTLDHRPGNRCSFQLSQRILTRNASTLIATLRVRTTRLVVDHSDGVITRWKPEKHGKSYTVACRRRKA